MILIKLFLVFIQIGSLAFGGGYAILPFIKNIVVDQYAWLTINEMTDIITISQMTPGPIAINAATFVGTKVYGVIGSVVATTATIIPQIIIMTILAKLFFSSKEISFMDKIIKALKPAVAALIFIASLNMFLSSVFNGTNISFNQISIIGAITFVVGFILYSRKMDIIKLIGIGALLGIILSLIIDFIL